MELSAVVTATDFGPNTEPDGGDTKSDSVFEDDREISINDMVDQEAREEDPILGVNKEAKASCGDDGELGDEKFIRKLRKKIALQELEKVRAENYTAQLRRNMAIAEYNKVFGKELPLMPLPDLE